MKRAFIILGILGAAAILLIPLGSPAICDGGYDLSVEIDPESAAGVVGVSYIDVSNAEMAEGIASAIDEYLKYMKHQTTADAFVVNVGFSYKESPLGFTWGHVQAVSHVVVVLQRDDGSRTVHMVAVPHRSVSRRVVVGPENIVTRASGAN